MRSLATMNSQRVRDLLFDLDGTLVDAETQTDQAIEAVVAGNAGLATASCSDYRSLPPSFWDGLVAGSLDLHGRSFT